MNYKDKYILFYLEGKKRLSEKEISRLLGISSQDDMPDSREIDQRIWIYVKDKELRGTDPETNGSDSFPLYKQFVFGVNITF